MRLATACGCLLLLGLAGCGGDRPEMSGRTATGAGVGAAVGGVAGAVVGDNDLLSVPLGAAAGAAIGAGIAHILDRQQDEVEEVLAPQRAEDTAEVERLDEGEMRITLEESIAFDPGSAAIRPDFLPTIERLAEVLADNDRAQVTIVGYSDTAEPDGRDLELSERRAEEVRQALVTYGVPADRVTAEGRGAAGAFVGGPGSGGERQRRVEILVRSVA